MESPTAKDGRRSGKGKARDQPFFLLRRAVAIGRALSVYAKAHIRSFVIGGLFALLLVGVRVAMPWPLHVLIEPWLKEGQAPVSNIFGWHPAVAVGVVYALLVVLLGFADYRLRLHFARFAIGMVRDIRAGVIRELGQMRRLHPNRTTGDWVTRLIGDSARLKAGMKGFLVHVATNGLLFLGVSAVLLWMEWSIGLIFLSASLLTILVTGFGASRIFRLALKFRRKESKIAHNIAERLALHEDEEDEDEDEEDGMMAVSQGANRSSGRHEANLTRIQGLTTWSAHFILALAMPAALWQGYRSVENGTITPGDLFVVMLYALMILGPMVRLSRQGARSGKILANADRLQKLLVSTRAERGGEMVASRPLRDGIALERVGLRWLMDGVKRWRFGPLTLRIEAGAKIALLGAPGSGKSTLLAVLAGRENYRGSIKWDGIEVRDTHFEFLNEQIGYVGQVPSWPQFDSAELLESVNKADPEDPIGAIFRYGGLKSFRSRLQVMEGDKISFEEVSHGESKALALVRYRMSGHSLKLIDDPVSEVASTSGARKLLSAFLGAQQADQTVIVALDRPVALDGFDRVIFLQKKGKVSFDGTPEEWAIRKSSSAAPPGNTA